MTTIDDIIKRGGVDSEKLIRSVSRSYMRSTGMEAEEVVGEASLAFVEACLKWDAGRANLSTFGVRRMRNHLNDWLDEQREQRRHESRMPEGETENDEDPTPPELRLLVTPERLVDFQERLNMASVDTKAVLRIIFDSPLEFFQMAESRKAKGWLKKALRVLGWSWGRIWKAFREIENIVDGEVPQE